MTTDLGSELVRREERRSPGLIDLIRPLSLALRAELELVRALRLGLLPRSDPGLEADLWSSRLLQARDANAVVLLPEVRHALHRELRERPRELERAWRLIRQYHAHLDPVVLREEQTSYWALRGDYARAERQLGPVIHALRRTPDDSRLRSWVDRLLERLPEGTRDSAAARTLRQEQSRSPSRRSGPALGLGLRRITSGLVISRPPDERALAWEVPADDPVGFQVSWPVARGWEGHWVTLAGNGTDAQAQSFVAAPAGLLRLRAAGQDEFDLFPQGERPLLYIRLDEETAQLPEVLREQLEDLGWRHEIVRWGQTVSHNRPAVLVYGWVDEPAWPIQQLIAELDASGADVRASLGDDLRSALQGPPADASAMVLVFDQHSFNHRQLQDLLYRILDKGIQRTRSLRIVTVPIDRDALEAVNRSGFRDRIELQTSPIAPGPAKQQLEQIVESLRDLLPPAAGAMSANASASASLLCSDDDQRLRNFGKGTGAGFTDWDDIAWALQHDQPLLLLTGRSVARLASQDNATAGNLERTLRAAIAETQVNDNPLQLRETLRGLLVEIESRDHARRMQAFLQDRFTIRPEESQRLRRARTTIDGQLGFLVDEHQAVVQRQSKGAPPTSAIALYGEEPVRKADAALRLYNGNFVVYGLNPARERLDALSPSNAPPRREQRCLTLIGTPSAELSLAGVLREPDDAGNLRLAVRLPEGLGLEGPIQVFGPLLNEGALIGVVFKVEPGADPGGEGDLAQALPVGALLGLLSPPDRVVLIERQHLRPDGDWGPVADRIDTAPAAITDTDHQGPLWIVSAADSEIHATDIQLEARWETPSVSGREGLIPAADSAVWHFPPNDALAMVEKLAAGAEPVARTVWDWLASAPALSPKQSSELLLWSENLLHGGGPQRPGLRWLLRGVDSEVPSEGPPPAQLVPPNAERQSGQAGPGGHLGTVRFLAVSSDGGVALSAGNSSNDQTVKVWDLRSGRPLLSLPDQAEGGGRTALALSERRFATGYREEILLWDLQTGQQLRRMKLDIRSPWVDLCFADPDTLLATEAEIPWLIDLRSGDAQPLGSGGGEMLAVAASDDGQLLAVLRRDAVSVWRRQDGRAELIDRWEIPPQGELFPFQRPPLCFGPGQRLRYGAPQMLWEPQAGARPVEKQNLANIADLARNGTALWVTSPGSLQAISADGAPLSPELQCAGWEIACTRLSADGSTVLAADFDHHLWLWWLGQEHLEDRDFLA